MKAGIKTPATLQRDRTVTKLEAIEDRATGTWHFRFGFRDHSMKLRTITVAGDIASGASKLLPELHKAGARLPADKKEEGGSSMQLSRMSQPAWSTASPGQDGKLTKTGPFGSRTETRSSAHGSGIPC